MQVLWSLALACNGLLELLMMNQPIPYSTISPMRIDLPFLSVMIRSTGYFSGFSIFFHCVSPVRQYFETLWSSWAVLLLECDHYLFDLLRIYRKSVKHAFNCQTRFKFRSRQHPKGHGKVNNLSFQCIERVWQEHFEKRIYFFVISEGIRTLKRKSDFLE